MIKHIRKVGILSKGSVYIIIGFLTLLAALRLGGRVSGKNAVIDFIENQIFGNILLVCLGLGLLMYTTWRMYAAIYDGKDAGDETKGILKRIGYFFSGLSYGALGVSALSAGIAWISIGGESSKQKYLNKCLNWEYGHYLIYVLSAIFVGVAIYQFTKGWSKSFLDDINYPDNDKARKSLRISGQIGHITRSVVFGILAYFLFRVAQYDNSSEMKGLQGVFKYIQSFSFGNVLLGLTAAGLILYGVYQYFLAIYSRYGNS